MSSRAGLALLLGAVAVLVAASSADRTVLNPKSSYPEGPLVKGGLLYYAEMGSDRVMLWDGTMNRPVWSRERCGPTSVARAGSDALNILCHREEAVVRISTSGATVKVIERDADGNSFRNPNASVNDDKGGVYFSSSGTFGPESKSEGAVLYLDHDDRLRRVAEGIHYANGVALSPDGRKLFVSEHLSRKVLLYDVDADDGSLSGGKVFIALDELVPDDPRRSWEVGPDGLATDRAGNLYVAEYGAGRFLIIGPDARLLATVEVPERYVTGLALSPDEHRIFVTGPTSRMIPFSGTVSSVANPVSVAH